MSDEICVGNNFSTFEKQDKILVGLSGGVDSSVCIQILKEQGFDVTALCIRFSPAHDKAVAAATEVASQLGVPLVVEDVTQAFDKEVITPFCESYCAGRTPSPCVMCNPLVKFKTLCTVADRMGIAYIASGHYATVEEENGKYYVKMAQSKARDQSYMLYRLPQYILQRLCLPVGAFEKPEIREMAGAMHLASADAPDSQEICFIPDGDYAAYIGARGLQGKQGKFIGPKGEDLGAHKGVIHYTVGQRKGLQIAYGEPVFVKRICESGDIELALGGDEFYSGITLENVTTADGTPFTENGAYTVKIRSRAVPAPCHVSNVSGTTNTITFDEPLRAPAPGQSAVLYNGELVLGGGEIVSMF